MKQWVPLLSLLTATTVLLFTNLGTLGLTDPDEGRNAEIAREMAETGDWITPTLNGEPHFTQPVFSYWLIGQAYRFLGINEFAARVPSALFLVALILLQYVFLISTRGAFIGLVGSLMLLLNMEMAAVGRMALTDGILIFFTTASLYGFWLGLHGGRKHRYAFWLFYAGMAMGVLTVGQKGIIVPLLGTIPYLFITHRWAQLWRKGFPIAGLLLLVLITSPWYGAMLWIHGSGYLMATEADTAEALLRTVGGHGSTILLYLPILFVAFFPWSGFLPAALFELWKRWQTTRRATPTDNDAHPSSWELELFAALWFIAVGVFLMLSATRLPHDIGLVFPAAALIAASYWSRCVSESDPRGLRTSLWIILLIGFALGLTLIASPLVYSTYIEQGGFEFPGARAVDPGIGPTTTGFVLIIGVGTVGYFGLAEQRRPGAFWAAAAMITVAVLITLLFTLPGFNKFVIDPPHELAYVAGVNLQPHDRFIAYGLRQPSLLFYARRRAVMIKPGKEDMITSHLAGPGRTMILLPSSLKSHLPAQASTFSPILERYGYSLLANEPMINLPPRPSSPSAIPPNPHGL